VQKSLGLIAPCNQKRLTKRYQEKRKQKIKQGKKADKNKLEDYYRKVWDANDHVCFETDEPLYKFHKWHVHHVLHKEDYPELAFNLDVAVLLSLEKHMLWHDLAPSDRPKKMPKTYSKYLELCKNYNITI
jgi:5-methylcytosine-specific restriction endonuclease McrA